MNDLIIVFCVVLVLAIWLGASPVFFALLGTIGGGIALKALENHLSRLE